MRSRDLILCGALSVALLAACGSSHKATTHSSAAVTTSSSPPPAKPPPGILGRVLSNNELPGFTGSPPTVDNGASSYVADSESGLSASQEASEEKRLTRLGFIRGIAEDLSTIGNVPGLSIVEQFKTVQGAKAEVVNQAATFPKENAGQGKYTTFAVSGIPGARGYGVLAGRDMGGINISFAKGPYYYLVGQELPGQGSPKRSIATLIAAAQHLYRRVSP